MMATAGGVCALRHTTLCWISLGFATAFAAYRLDTPWQVLLNDIANQMVFSEIGASVGAVPVAGGSSSRIARSRLSTWMDCYAKSIR